MADDVRLIADLGLDAYRFSIAWPRVQPTGSGPISQAGLDFYSSLVDRLLERGIEPVATLYHWDLPQALEDTGGWPARETAFRFAEYAQLVGRAIGDRVRRWSTINEPWCASMLGYAAGVHAPGRADANAAVAASHHLLLAHGLAVEMLRATVRRDAEIAITLNPYPVVAAGPDEADHDAVRRVDGVANRLWYDAVLRGCYPDDVLADFSTVSDLSHIRDGDLEQISRPVDAVGVNYYRRHHVRFGHRASARPPYSMWPGSSDIQIVQPPAAQAANGWAIEPEGLTETLSSVTAAYGPLALYVHENGAAFDDNADSTGKVLDEDRIDFLRAHVEACLDALEAGVDLRGYFIWSLLDNFEWAEGFRYRFGIVRVDPDTRERTPKTSALWYSDFVRRQRFPA